MPGDQGRVSSPFVCHDVHVAVVFAGSGERILNQLERRVFTDYRLEENCHRIAIIFHLQRDITNLRQAGLASVTKFETWRGGRCHCDRLYAEKRRNTDWITGT